MTLQPIKSKLFSHMGYDGETFVVRYNNGRQYDYANVREEIWELLQSIAKIDSISLGSALHWLIIAHPTVYPFKVRKTPCELNG